MDSVQELRINTSAATAEPSGAAGGAHHGTYLVTKSGSLAWHGSGFEYFRNEALDALNQFHSTLLLTRLIFRQNQFPGSIGRRSIPKLKKTFFFAAAQPKALRAKSATPLNALAPDATIRSCNFTCRNPILLDLFSPRAQAFVSPVPNNVIPARPIHLDRQHILGT